METTIANPPLNAMQIHFLHSLRFIKTDEMFQELKQLISNYYFQKLKEETNQWWYENEMNQEKLDEMFANSHYRSSNK